MSSLPPPLPPSDYPVLLKRSTTWLPEEVGVPRSLLREARKLAARGTVPHAHGRRDAVARYLLALAASHVGLVSLVARIPLFQAPGILLADPRREAFYWTLDPGLPAPFEQSASGHLATLLRRQALEEADAATQLVTGESPLTPPLSP